MLLREFSKLKLLIIYKIHVQYTLNSECLETKIMQIYTKT